MSFSPSPSNEVVPTCTDPVPHKTPSLWSKLLKLPKLSKAKEEYLHAIHADVNTSQASGANPFDSLTSQHHPLNGDAGICGFISTCCSFHIVFSDFDTDDSRDSVVSQIRTVGYGKFSSFTYDLQLIQYQLQRADNCCILLFAPNSDSEAAFTSGLSPPNLTATQFSSAKAL
ncbi:hypothetical protein GYMLUDRAFT_249065 [Collybiopsis luxurians FD-317 M1]|uniref:Uncharacterized protein n=1 Tax=Collybiopsis luxurians FD-317 M1 TaxID=944289 RepID=A0A0D0CAL7_9AGAR|nr:hypothetical protein GYMLUDRAFT_249065 [Collybiopsis luxurians FD-317 M1]